MLQGKFTFKNGRIYEGMFEKDHIVEYPDFNVDGATTPDITSIRTRTPLPSGEYVILKVQLIPEQEVTQSSSAYDFPVEKV